MSLEDQLDATYAEGWKPEPGDKLIGKVIALDQRDDAYSDGTYPIVTIRTDDDKELAWHGFHAVARAELAKQRPKVGERIGVKYVGKREGGQGESGYAVWRVVVERDGADAEIDWAKVGAEAEGELRASSVQRSADDDEIPF